MRNIISYSKFEETVGVENLNKIVSSFYQGFKEGVIQIDNANQFGIMVEYEPRTKAGVAHEHIKARLKNSLSDTDGLQINKWKGIFALLFSDVAFCRIKKLRNGTSMVSVMLTRQQKSFNSQLELDGFPSEPTFITLGYYADKAFANLLGVFATCHGADGLVWFKKIGGEGFTQLPLFDENIPLIPRIVAPAAEDKPKRVRAKRDPKKDTGTDTNNV